MNYFSPSQFLLARIIRRRTLLRWKLAISVMLLVCLFVIGPSKTQAQTPTITTQQGYPIGQSLNSIAYGNGTYIVGLNNSTALLGSLYSSTDGTTWSKIVSPSIPTDMYFSGGGAYGNGVFVFAGNAGKIITSSDNGATWISQTSGTTYNLINIKFLNGAFYAVGKTGSFSNMENVVLSSTDGITWTKVLEVLNSNVSFSNIAYGGGAYVVAYGFEGAYGISIYRSTTGTAGSWTSQSITTADPGINGVDFAKDRFFLFGVGSTVFTSTNGSSWTDITSSTINLPNGSTSNFQGGATQFSQAISDGTRYYLLGTHQYYSSTGTAPAPSPNGVVLTSTNATTFTLEPKSVSPVVNEAAYLNGKFFMITGVGPLSSTDGINYTYPGGSFYSLASNGTAGYALVGQGTSPEGVIFNSTNFSSFSQAAALQNTANTSLTAVIYDGSKYVAVGQGGTVATSPNGTTWTVGNTNYTDNLNSIAYGNGIYVAVGVQGNILRSTNGTTWTQISKDGATGSNYNSVRYLNGMFIAVGGGTNVSTGTGRISYSTDGQTWSTNSYAPTVSFQDIAFNGATYLLIGRINNATASNRVFFSTTTSDITSSSLFTANVTVPTASTGGVALGTIGQGALAYTSGKFVAAVNQQSTPFNAYVLVSSDGGVSWTAYDVGTTGRLRGAIAENNKVRIVGFNDVKVTVEFASTNATPTVDLSVSANSGTESAATVITVTATASAAVTGAQTVNVGVSGVGITTGDYTLSNATITIPNGQTTGSVTFTVVDDALVEGTETATLTISSPSSGIALGSTVTQNIAITDNDVVSIFNGPNNFPDAVGPTDTNDDFSNKSSSVPSNTVPGSTIDPQSVAFSNTVKNTGTSLVNVSLRPSAPITPSDLPTGTTVTLTHGSNSATYAYTGTTFTFVSSSGFVGGNPISANNPIQISGLAANATASYGVTIDLPNGTSLSTDSNIERGFPVVITAFIDANANGLVDDAVKNNTIDRVYTGFLQQLKQSRILQGIGPTVQGADGTLSTVPKQPAPGNIIEYVVSYKNISQAQSGSGNITLSVSKVIITEDGTQNSNNWAVENSGAIFTSHVLGAASGTVQYFSGNPATNLLGGEQTGTTAASDVTKYINTLSGVIDPGASGTVTFQRRVNQAASGQEILNIAMATYEDSNNPNVSINATTNSVSVTVSSTPTVNLSVSTNSGTEAAATVVTVTATASAAVTGAQTVNVGVSGVGITAGDYSLSNTTITIPDGQTTGSVTFTVVNDALAEGTETAILTISNPSSGVLLGTTTTQNVVITDNDVAGVTINQSDGATSVIEGGATDSYTVVLNTQPTANVTINITSGTQVTTSPASNVIFTPANWNVPQTVTVTAVDDAIIEGNHTGTITHSVTSSDANYNGVTVASVDATITDNDLPASVCVTTDCSAYNGNYTKGADYNSRPSYTNGTAHIFHSGTSWYLGKGGLGATQIADIVFEAPSMSSIPPTTGWGANEDGSCPDATFSLALAACPCVTPTTFNLTGGGSFCSGGTGVVVGLSGSETGVNYQLKRDGSNVNSAVSGSGSMLAFGTFTTAGTYTVEATRTAGGCTQTMSGNATVTVISLPTSYNVTGGGSYCAGGSGVAVGISSSQTGVNYQLKKDGSNVGSAAAGTGAALSFGSQTDAGTYTVEATTATGSCVATMSGNATVTVISLPTAYNVTGGGSYCAGGSGVAVGLSNSQTGVNYQLKKDGSNVGSAVAGTGAALSFGNRTDAGTYTVEATTATGGCVATMSGNATVTVISLPTSYNITGGGPYCAGGGGSAVGLTSSQIGVNYQLKKDGSNVGSVVAGTGSAISFGNQTGAGTYTVEATTTTGSCVATMSGNVVVSVVTLPTVFNVTGGGSFCAGGTGVAVSLSSSETGVSYQLKKNGINVGSAVAGTGSALPLGLQTVAGTYTVEASKVGGGPSPTRLGAAAAPSPNATTCTQAMTGSVEVTVISLPTPYNVTGGGSYCAGGTGMAVGLANSQTGVNYQLKKDGINVGSAVAGTGAALSFGSRTDAGTYTVEATTATGSCASSMTGSVVVTVNVLPTDFSMTGGGSYCQGGTGVVVGLSSSETGVNYQLMLGSTMVGSVFSGTGSALSFGLQTSPGSYTVVATNSSTNCVLSMKGSAQVAYYTMPLATISGSTVVCKGGIASTITFTGSNGAVPYTFSYQLNGGAVQKITTTGGSSSVALSQSSNAEGIYNYTLLGVGDANCSQSQSGSAVVTVQSKPVISLSTQQVTLNEGNSQELCDIDANPVNGLQFSVMTSCVVGLPVWRVQVGNGSWSNWSSSAPTSQTSNNQLHRYQAACDANCPSTYTSPIEVKLNYRASIPQNVSLIADGVNVSAGETKEICNIDGNVIVFNASCASGEMVLYSVDGGEYSSVAPTQMVDGQYHNYRVRCRKSDGTVSCVETESGMMRIRLTSMSMVPVASLSVTSGCGVATSFSGTTNCGSMTTLWYNASTDAVLTGLPSQTPSVTTSYYARCQAESGCMSEKSNVVTYTVAAVSDVPVVTVSSDIVCTGVEVTVSTSCPAGASALWNTGVTENSFKVSFANVTKQSYSVRCVYANGCQSSASASKEVMWKAFELTIINIGESKSGTKTNSRSAWAGQFVTPDAGPSLDQSTQTNPTVYYSENLNKTAPRYWTIHVDACSLGENGSLTYDLLATPETGVVRSYNTHENNAPYFMFANRSGYTELYAQNHPLYGFYADNGSGGNVYDEGFPKGLYKLGVRYWDMKGWGSIYPSTRKPQGNVLAYQEYWFRIQSKDGVGTGAARTAADLATDRMTKGTFAAVMPNPVSSVLRLKVADAKDQKVQVSLLDVSGRAILQRNFVPETNAHHEEFNVNEMANGMYFLKVNAGDKQATLKVVKVQ